MSLITDIGTIITGLYPDSTYVLSSKFQANVTTYFEDESNLPIIILDNELSTNNEIKQNNNIQKNRKIVISFLDLDDADNTDTQSEAIRYACELKADKVATQIYQLDNVRPSGNQTYKVTPLFHVFTSNLTGVALEMTVNYNIITNFCPPEAAN